MQTYETTVDIFTVQNDTFCSTGKDSNSDSDSIRAAMTSKCLENFRLIS